MNEGEGSIYNAYSVRDYGLKFFVVIVWRKFGREGVRDGKRTIDKTNPRSIEAEQIFRGEDAAVIGG